MSSLVILAAAVSRYRAEKHTIRLRQTDRQTPLKTIPHDYCLRG